MLNKFKVGDKVKCLNADRASFIEVGKIYTIAACDSSDGEPTVQLEEMTYVFIFFWERRFELVPKVCTCDVFISGCTCGVFQAEQNDTDLSKTN